MQSVTSNDIQGRETHQRTTRHYSRSGEPPVAVIEADGTMRRNWRETYRCDAKNGEMQTEKNCKANGRLNLDGSGNNEPFGAYKRATINRLLCSWIHSRTIDQN